LAQSAASEANVLITGETGTGKEVFATTIHRNSRRAKGEFVVVDCASMTETLVESTLFGHERGAFTGAEQKRRGKFELAHGGVLFLDEIGDMPILLQSKLLHVLQSGEFAPLGSEKEFKTDTWLIAATNHDLEDEIKKKKFREDLYYRLNIIKIYISPLRERPKDIPPLINYYIGIYTSKFNNRNILQPSQTILNKLTEYHWPGNVRELQNVLKRVLVLGNWDEIIDELDFSGSIQEISEPKQARADQPISDSNRFLFKNGEKPDLESLSLKEIKKRALDRIEKEAISYVLEKTGWNRSKASKILQISYKTLLYKISDLGITPPAG
jgi:transcriptional regulator with PAS, ATPase and Fis domain